MDKEKLLAFLHVAEQHSFAKGSEQLFLNQSTVSARIKALERELEVELFEREKGKGVRLSVYGELFLPYARKIVTLMEESKQQLKKERQFSIRIGASIYGYHLLPTVLDLLHRHTPGLEVTIVSGYSPEILSMVQEGDVDIGLVNDIIRFENVEHVRLLEEELFLIISPNDQERYTAPQPVYPLLDKPLLVFGRSDTYHYKSVEHPILYDYQRQHQIQFKKIIYIDQIEPLKKLIKQGNGIAFLPQFLIEQEVNEGDLVAARIHPPLRPMGIHLIFRKETNESKLKVVQLIKNHFVQSDKSPQSD